MEVPRALLLKNTIYAMLLHGIDLGFYGLRWYEQPINFFSILNFDEGTNVQILGAGSATSTAECRMGCRLYLVRVLVTTVVDSKKLKVRSVCGFRLIESVL